jgi:hypothetical protein
MDNDAKQPTPALFATWFQPSQGRIGPTPVNDLGELRRLLARLPEREPVYVVLARDRGLRGSVTLHMTEDRTCICYVDTLPGRGIFSFCHDPDEKGPDNKIAIVGSHAQADYIHRSSTVPRQQGQRALEYFLLQGERDPGLNWVEQKEQVLSLEHERAEPGTSPDRRGM